ncbi:MAG TPA: UDP-N-acetylmuramate dehydrogenase [Actinomycetes bacterium]|nr:UDP-N-acetylmuramate dehydrogenase [Actinomycetes bacterium]
MLERPGVPFSALTSLRVGGPAGQLVEAHTRAELIDAVSDPRFEAGLVLGGGSNLVVADAGVEVRVVAVRTAGVTVTRDADDVVLDVAAGEPWEALVERCVAESWSGVEALSGIPGSVGATPIQNVGAYGQEVAEVVSQVEVFDRKTQNVLSMSGTECAFGYRSSVFKVEPQRFVVISVSLRLRASPLGAPVQYAQLAGRLGVDVGTAASLSDVREAVLDLRRSKGMVLDDEDHDTWSAGSFFMNPVLEASYVPADAPRWDQADGRVKTSAAWLIEHSGFPKGFGTDLGTGAAALSSKHTLAITNRGGATTADVLLLARTVRAGVHERFGVVLRAEPTLVGVAL